MTLSSQDCLRLAHHSFPDAFAGYLRDMTTTADHLRNTLDGRWRDVKNRVRQELEYTLNLAFENVWQEAQKRKCTLRTAAYVIAIDRVYRATLLNGIS